MHMCFSFLGHIEIRKPPTWTGESAEWKGVNLCTRSVKRDPRDNALNYLCLQHNSTPRAHLAQKCHAIMTHCFGLT